MTEPFRIQSGADFPCGGCCDPPACRALYRCGNYPWQSVEFAFSTLTSADPPSDLCCRPRVTPAGTYIRFVDPASCLNRTWTLPMIRASSGELRFDIGDGETVACRSVFALTCIVTVHDAGGPDFQWPVNAALTITTQKNLDTGAADPVVVELTISADGETGCPVVATYRAEYTLDAFPCGPWTLDLISASDLLVTDWPATLAVSVGSAPAVGTASEAIDFDCCELDTEACGTLPPPPFPTPPFGTGTDGSDGGGGGGVPGELVGALENCCPNRDDTVSVHLPFTVVRILGDACLETVGTLTWTNGFKVWIANDIKCGAFITYVVYCSGTDWCLEVFVNGTLVVNICGNYATSTGNCSPLDLLWSVDIDVPGVVVGTYEIHVFES